jgi:8-oxo-dGTP pyrophosphatase MutT (NUDIX family)
MDYLSRIKGNLPLVPGINGRDEVINSAVMLLLVPVGNEYHMVFEKRSRNILQAGEICFPGGRFSKSKDRDTEMTAVRETSEELGIPTDSIKVLGRLDTVVALMGQVIDVYVGASEIGPQDMHADPKEVEKIFTIPVSHFEEKGPEEYQVLLKQYPSYIDEESGEKIVLLPSAELGLPERYEKPWSSFKYKVFAYRTDEGTIWGVTARIIKDFIKKQQGLI